VKELDGARFVNSPARSDLFSNVNGVPLADERFFPLYEMPTIWRGPAHSPDTSGENVDAMQDYWLMLWSIPFDTTLATAHLVFNGVPSDSQIKWVLGHLGGAIPYSQSASFRHRRSKNAARRFEASERYLKKFTSTR